MELLSNCRKLTTGLSRFWHREAGPMNWKNPVRVTAYIGWEIFQRRGPSWSVNGSGTASAPDNFFWKFPPPSSSFSEELGIAAWQLCTASFSGA